MRINKIRETSIKIIDGDRGKNYPSANDLLSSGFCLFLSNKNIVNNKLNLNGSFYISQIKHEQLRSGSLEKNDLVITTRGTLGNILYVDEFFPLPARINSGMVIIRHDSQFLSRYLYYLFQSDYFQNQIKELQSGAAQPQLPIKDLEMMQIPIIDIGDQQHIVNTIGSIDDLIEKSNEVINELEHLSKLLYLNHKNQRIGNLSLDNCCDIKTGKLDANASKEDGIYPFFTCGQDVLKIDKYAFDCEAIIISGNGEISVKYYKGKFNAYQRTYVLSPSRLIYLFLEECKLSVFDLKNNSQGSVIKFITKGMLEKISIVDDAEAIKLNDKLHGIYKLITQKKKEVETLLKIKKHLLMKYF